MEKKSRKKSGKKFDNKSIRRQQIKKDMKQGIRHQIRQQIRDQKRNQIANRSSDNKADEGSSGKEGSRSQIIEDIKWQIANHRFKKKSKKKPNGNVDQTRDLISKENSNDGTKKK